MTDARRRARAQRLGARPRPVPVHGGRRALRRRPRRQADGGAQCRPPRPHPLPGRRRQGHGSARPRLAVPPRGGGRHGPRRHPGAPAPDPAAHIEHRPLRRRCRAQCGGDHRQPGVHPSHRPAHPQAAAGYSHHRLRLPQRVGLAPRPLCQDAPLHRPRAGAVAVRAGRARAPGRAAVQLRRPSADRAPSLACGPRPGAVGHRGSACCRAARCWSCCPAAAPRRCRA